MKFCAPLKLGPFIVDADGRLTPSTPDRFPSFRVHWRGHVVRARLTTATPRGGVLALRAVLGRIRSTGRQEAPGTPSRRTAFAAMRTLPGTLPSGWKLALLPDHRVMAEAEKHLVLPTSAEDLVTELTLFVLRLNPYLELLAEGMGIEPAEDGPVGPGEGCAAPGNPKTWPG